MRKVRKAVIPAAGLGTRFLPATKAQPKEMMPIVDKPAIQYIVEEAAASGIEDILIITGRNKRSIEDHFDRSAELEFNLEKRQDGDAEGDAADCRFGQYSLPPSERTARTRTCGAVCGAFYRR